MEDFLKYFDLLELTPEATMKEIRRNYSHMKSLYSGNSIEIVALNAELSEEVRRDYLARLDEAYEQLNLLLEKKKPAALPKIIATDDELRSYIKGIHCFTGAALKSIRERMGVDLKDMFAVTRIQTQHLLDIENEAFESFHAEVYLRSFVTEYTHFLALDTPTVLADYMPRYREWAAGNGRSSFRDVDDWLTKMT